MTRDQAAQIITATLKGPNDIATDSAHVLAAHIATALDALGLLNLVVVYGVAPSPETHELAPDDQPDFIRATPEGHQAWAEQRKRT